MKNIRSRGHGKTGPMWKIFWRMRVKIVKHARKGSSPLEFAKPKSEESMCCGSATASKEVTYQRETVKQHAERVKGGQMS